MSNRGTQSTSRRKLKRDRDAAYQRYLREPLPPPFEHLDGAWWAGVIDQLEQQDSEKNPKTPKKSV